MDRNEEMGPRIEVLLAVWHDEGSYSDSIFRAVEHLISDSRTRLNVNLPLKVNIEVYLVKMNDDLFERSRYLEESMLRNIKQKWQSRHKEFPLKLSLSLMDNQQATNDLLIEHQVVYLPHAVIHEPEVAASAEPKRAALLYSGPVHNNALTDALCSSTLSSALELQQVQQQAQQASQRAAEEVTTKLQEVRNRSQLGSNASSSSVGATNSNPNTETGHTAGLETQTTVKDIFDEALKCYDSFDLLGAARK